MRLRRGGEGRAAADGAREARLTAPAAARVARRLCAWMGGREGGAVREEEVPVWGAGRAPSARAVMGHGTEATRVKLKQWRPPASGG